MDCQSTNIFEIWKEMTILAETSVKEINKNLEQQTLRLDVVFNELLHSAHAQKNSSDYVPEKKMSKRQSKAKSGQVEDVFFAEPSFQQPAIPPVRKTKRQASILAMDKLKGVRESATISCGASTRASRARKLSTFMDIAPLDCPKANSTFVVGKNIDEFSIPDMFSPENKNLTFIVPPNSDKTKHPEENIDLISKTCSTSLKNKSPAKIGPKRKGDETLANEKKREKLEDIDVNVEEHVSKHMTRTMIKKLQERKQIEAKKKNVNEVLLEKQISTPLKPIEEIALTPHHIRENEAEKRKQLFLKSKADQKKFDEQHLKVAKQREEQIKRAEEKLKKAAEENKKKEEKQKQREIAMKEEALKKQKLAEIRLAEINAKRKQAEEAKILKMQKAEIERFQKENEMKKKNEIKIEKNKSVRPKTAATTSKPIPLPKIKTQKIELNKNDYGLNDVSARDSSEDESGPKKPVPSWAQRDNRKAVLELQYHVNPVERDLFFDCPKNMNLKEMFKGWNIRDRQRTSSAVWNTPPRFSEYLRRY